MDKQQIKLPFTGVKYADLQLKEIPTSPSEVYSHMAGRATRTFHVKWAYRWDLAAYMLGWSTPVYSPTGTFLHISRVLPEVYKPTIATVKAKHFSHGITDDWGNVLSTGGVEEKETERPWLWATSISSMRGVGRQSKTIFPNGDSVSSYDLAEVSIDHEVRHYRIISDEELVEHSFSRRVNGKDYGDEYYAGRFCSFHPQPNTLAVEVPQDGMVWAGDAVGGLADKKGYSNARRLKQSLDIQVRWYGVPGVPHNIKELLGTVNDRSWESHPPGHVRLFGPQTLIYIGFRINTYRQITGAWAHDISFLFSHFKEGHNADLCFPPGDNYRWTPQVSLAYSTTNTQHYNKMHYPERNFNDLFLLPDLL